MSRLPRSVRLLSKQRLGGGEHKYPWPPALEVSTVPHRGWTHTTVKYLVSEFVATPTPAERHRDLFDSDSDGNETPARRRRVRFADTDSFTLSPPAYVKIAQNFEYFKWEAHS
jgi:hypothetical protein